MAKKRSKKRSRTKQRYTARNIPKRSVLFKLYTDDSRIQPIFQNQDRRYFYPDDDVYKDSLGRNLKIQPLDSITKAPNRPPKALRASRLAFLHPNKAKVCKQRKDRRKALFRSSKAGKGIKGPQKRIMREVSRIICRR